MIDLPRLGDRFADTVEHVAQKAIAHADGTVTLDGEDWSALVDMARAWRRARAYVERRDRAARKAE